MMIHDSRPSMKEFGNENLDENMHTSVRENLGENMHTSVRVCVFCFFFIPVKSSNRLKIASSSTNLD